MAHNNPHYDPGWSGFFLALRLMTGPPAQLVRGSALFLAPAVLLDQEPSGAPAAGDGARGQFGGPGIRWSVRMRA
ncbi:hypothetical protein ACH4CC_25935 [Streptomyces lydicus]|uniref:hypothetical protein n=1 Tax=Streptomyces lydicus TaxID=47763 RepID=UPI0037B467DF